MTAHIPRERAMPSQQAVDLVVALQRCLTSFHALQEEPPVLDGQDGDGFAMLARYVEARRVRAMIFGQNLFADPAWDMLLDLTAARAEHARVSVTSLCIAAAVPPTTALRWISQMVEAGLFERQCDDTDRRRAFITLSENAAHAMARYFEEIGTRALMAA